MEELADVATAPRSKRDERKPWGFNSALLRRWKVTGWSRGTVGSGVRRDERRTGSNRRTFRALHEPVAQPG